MFFSGIKIAMRPRLLLLAAATITGFVSAMAQTPATEPTPSIQPTPIAIALDPKVFDAYVGQYQDPVVLGSMTLSFFRNGDKFYVRATNQDPVEIFPSSDTSFFVKAFRAEMEFVRDASGKVTGVVFRQGGGVVNAKRTADTPEPDTRIPYKRTEAMIPMRDGVKLYTVILTPETQTEPAAILIDRTPYGVKGTTANRGSSRPELAKEGYIFVYQDIRGRHDSEGKFMMIRPPRDQRDPKSVDESTDTYDTIDWLIKNVPKNNGRVGIYGVSYDGWLAAVALRGPHPALKASSPQAPMTDAWMGDDFFHNGAWRMSYGHEYSKMMESSKTQTDVTFDIDAYDWYLNQKTVANLTASLGNKLPTYNSFVAHPAYDEYWQARSSARYLKKTDVPTLVVGGWWDQEDEYGALATYRALEKFDRDNKVFFVMGPWNHGGWGGRGRRLGAIDFGSDTGQYFREEIQAPFFACALKLKCTKKQPEAEIFQTGSNKWMTYDAWPPKQATRRDLYFHSDGKLSFEKPAKENGKFDSYVSDPASPIPYRKRPIEATYDPRGSQWSTWRVQDQRFLGERKDMLRWQTEILTEDVTLTGDVVAHLFASTTGSDSDWVVKLIDVYPDEYPADPKMGGYRLMVSDEILRGRYRRSWEKPEPITPNKVLDYTVDMRGNDHVFAKGHRIMIEVQSTWFPLYDRNPQIFVNNIFTANESDFKAATQRIYRAPKDPSHVSISVVNGR